MDYKVIGKTLRTLRERRGIRQHVVAAELGMTASNLSLIEAGKVRTPVENLEKYAAIMGCALSIVVVDPADPVGALLSRFHEALPLLRPVNQRALGALLEVYVAEDARPALPLQDTE